MLGRSIQDLRPLLALQWHPTRNENRLPSDFSISSNEIAWWRCTSRLNSRCEKGCDHPHEWSAIIANRADGRHVSGCPWCSGKGNVVCPCQSLQTREPEFALEWHETKNDPLLPTQVTVYSSKKVWWRCALGHEWDAYISARTQDRTRCPTCKANKGETRLEEILSTHALVESHHKRSIQCYDNVLAKWRKLVPDAMGTLTNGRIFLVEIDGDQHFHVDSYYNQGEYSRLRDQICRDLAKNQYAADHAISVLRIAYTEFDQIDNWVQMFMTECSKTDVPVVMRSNPALYSICCLWVWSEHEPFADVGKSSGERQRQIDRRRKRMRHGDRRQCV